MPLLPYLGEIILVHKRIILIKTLETIICHFYVRVLTSKDHGPKLTHCLSNQDGIRAFEIFYEAVSCLKSDEQRSAFGNGSGCSQP